MALQEPWFPGIALPLCAISGRHRWLAGSVRGPLNEDVVHIDVDSDLPQGGKHLGHCPGNRLLLKAARWPALEHADHLITLVTGGDDALYLRQNRHLA